MLWMIAFSLLPLVGVGYVAWHVWCLVPLGVLWKSVAAALVVSMLPLMFVTLSGLTERLPLGAASALYEVGTSVPFVLLYAVLLFLTADLLRLLHVLQPSALNANWWTLGGIVLLLTVVLTAGNIHYRNKYREAMTVTTDKPLDRPLRIVMASDLHIGYHNRRAELARWVDMINAEKPDMVLIAGDIIDMSVRPLVEERMAEEFLRLTAPVYACLGNHEYYSGEPQARQFYRDARIRLLRDEAVTAAGICIIGRDDRTNRHRKSLGAIMRQADRSLYTILLDHQPYSLEQAERQGIDLQLSGHTHHGQVWPVSWITDMVYECAYGRHRRGRTDYYVSSGLGIWGGKYRIGTRSEYLVITLTN